MEALRRAGPQPSCEKVVEALNGLRRFDVGGMGISYLPTDHSSIDHVDLSIISVDGKFLR